MIEVRAFKHGNGRFGVAVIAEGSFVPLWHCDTDGILDTARTVMQVVDSLNDEGMVVQVTAHTDIVGELVSMTRRRFAAGQN